MKEVEAQKIIENLESIAAEKGADALTGEIIEERCKSNNMDPEDFRNFIRENVKGLQELEKLSLEKLEQVAGYGVQKVKKGMASLLAATSLLSPATNFTASAVRPTTANAKQCTNKSPDFRSKEKILPAMKIGFTAVGASLFVWAFSSLVKTAVQATQLSRLQVTADNLQDSKFAMLDFARQISTDIQGIYEALIDTQPQMAPYSDSFVGKIVDSMQEKLKHSFILSDTDCSVEIPGVSGQIKVSTFLSDYVYARLYGKRRGSYDLAVCFMTHYLKSLWRLRDVLLMFPTPNGPDYTVYKQILDDVNKALKLENGNIETLQQVRDRRKARERAEKEQRQQKDIATIATLEDLQKCFTTGSAVWQRYADCITEIQQDKNPASEIKNLTDGMQQELSVLRAIHTLQAGFSDPKTIFEKYLFDMSNYFKEKLTSGATYASFACGIDTNLQLTLKFLAQLARSSDYAKDKTCFLDKLKLFLQSLINLLRHQLNDCCDNDESGEQTLYDLLETTYAFYNIVYDDKVCSKYKDESAEDKCTPVPTDREFLQTLFNNDCVREEQKRVCAVGSTIDFVAGVAKRRKTEADNVFNEYQCSYAVINEHLRKDPDRMDIDDDENYCESLEGRLKVAIKTKKTEKDLELFRGVSYNIHKRNYGYQKYERMLNETVKEVVINGKINWEKLAKKLESAAQTGEKIIFTEKAFLSATTSKSIATGHIEGASSGQFSDECDAVVYHIHVPKNTPYYCTAYCSTHLSANFFFLPETKLHLKKMTIEGGEKCKDGTTRGTTDHPQLVSLYFEMIPPTEDELAEAARQRNAWVSRCHAMSANQANIENPKE